VTAVIRILHSSDWHLGRFLYGRSLLEDQAFALARLQELITQTSPHALVISGDVFDRSFPPEDAVNLLDSFLSEVTIVRRIPVFLIPGNHDSADRLGFAARLLRPQGLHIFSRIEDAFESVELRGDNGHAVRVYGIPFVDPAMIAHAFSDPSLRSHQDALQEFCHRIRQTHERMYPGQDSILLCHAFVIGGQSSESERELSIGGSSQVDARVFDGFSYVALGHLHKPQAVGAEHIRYSGSLLPYSKSEIGHSKAIIEVHLAPTGTCAIKPHQLPALRELHFLEATLAELLEQGKDDPRARSYILVSLTDKGAVLDAFAKLRQVYPYLLHVTRSAGHNPEQLPGLKESRREERSVLSLFGEFFRDATGTDLSSEENIALLQCLSKMDLS
jgi:exonuclease SbcD